MIFFVYYFKYLSLILNCDRLDLLVKTIKSELIKNYDSFVVKIIQLYYSDNHETYDTVKEENITDIVSI